MKKEYRIKKTQEIDCIFKKRNSVGTKYFVLYKKINEANNHFRFAISIGKKYGNAVSRNLMKRRIREIVRKNKDNIQCFDYVIVVKPSSNTLGFDEIMNNIEYLFNKR